MSRLFSPTPSELGKFFVKAAEGGPTAASTTWSMRSDYAKPPHREDEGLEAAAETGERLCPRCMAKRPDLIDEVRKLFISENTPECNTIAEQEVG